MTDAEFLTALKTLSAYAAQRETEAFKATDREAFDLWQSRARQLQGATSMEEMRGALAKAKAKSPDKDA